MEGAGPGATLLDVRGCLGLPEVPPALSLSLSILDGILSARGVWVGLSPSRLAAVLIGHLGVHAGTRAAGVGEGAGG